MIASIILQMTSAVPDTAVSHVIPAVAAAPSAVAAQMSLWDLIVKGGPIMIPIALLSIFAIYLFIERWMNIAKNGKYDSNFMHNIRDLIHHGNMDAAKALCKNANTPTANMIEKGITRIGKPIREVESALENTGKLQIGALEKNVGFIGTIAAIAPMFGFLGTIFGVIKIFYNIALADNISIGLIAGGLYQKMITSAAGLLVGILAFVLHHIIVNMIDRRAARMEADAVEFIDLLQEPVK